jgi:hypothetical protein
MQIIAYKFICTYLYLNFTLIGVSFEKQILDPKKSCEGVKISKVKMFSPQHVVETLLQSGDPHTIAG